MSRIRLIKHESVPQTGSYEVRFPDGRPSVYHYFDALSREAVTFRLNQMLWKFVSAPRIRKLASQARCRGSDTDEQGRVRYAGSLSERLHHSRHRRMLPVPSKTRSMLS
jgi:hypothetical protein